MQRFKNILVVVDNKTDHDVLLGRAVTLAQKNQARLTVVNVVKDVPHIEQMPVAPESPADVQESNIKIIEELPYDTPLPIIAAALAEVQELVRDATELPPGAHISAPSKSPVSIHKFVIEEDVQENRNAHWRWLTKLLQRHSLEDLKYHLYMLKGEARALIPELAKKMEVDLIVMGTVGRGGIAGLLIGNTAEKILQQIDCSVLAVKPNGFVTPVNLDEE